MHRAERMIAHYDLAEPCIESGYFLWLAGSHWELWRDAGWLPRVLPAVERHMDWLIWANDAITCATCGYTYTIAEARARYNEAH